MSDEFLSVQRSAQIAALTAALCKVQKVIRNPPKESVNPHFKSRYADLPTVLDTVRPVLTDNGLAVMQFPCEMGDAPALTTILAHTSGEWVQTAVRLRPAKNDPQGVGSALTYMRRYCLQAVCGIAADDDDDGNAATTPAARKPARPVAATPPATTPASAGRDAAWFRLELEKGPDLRRFNDLMQYFPPKGDPDNAVVAALYTDHAELCGWEFDRTDRRWGMKPTGGAYSSPDDGTIPF